MKFREYYRHQEKITEAQDCKRKKQIKIMTATLAPWTAPRISQYTENGHVELNDPSGPALSLLLGYV